MALIKCSECGKEVSNKAPSCLNCGNPINRNVVELVTNQPLKIEPELTSKKWKKWKLISWGAIVLGFFMIGSSGGSFDSNDISFWVGFSFIGYGFIALVIGHIGAWYTDKRTR